jgi:hypothetical protein
MLAFAHYGSRNIDVTERALYALPTSKLCVKIRSVSFSGTNTKMAKAG